MKILLQGHNILTKVYDKSVKYLNTYYRITEGRKPEVT
jgi:hypothetical protein